MILGQCPSDIVLTKDSSINLKYRGARLHHYDSLIKGNVPLSDLLYEHSNNYFRELIGQLLSNSVEVFEECENEHLRTIYGSIIVQSILVYYQQIFNQSLFTLQWIRDFPKLVLNIVRMTKDQSFLKELIPKSCPSSSTFSDQLFTQYLEQIPSKSSFQFFNCQFEIPSSQNQFNSQWFLSKHSNIQLNFNDYPSKDKSLQEKFSNFTEKLNRLWHEIHFEQSSIIHLDRIHDQIHLLKQRLPPKIKLPKLSHSNEDFLSIALYQV